MRSLAVACAATLVLGVAPGADAAYLDRCYPLVGHVTDAAGRAIPGARATTPVSCSGPSSVDTSSSGRYELYVPGGNLGTTADVTITKTGYDTVTQRASVTPAVSPSSVTSYTYSNVDFTLLLQVTTTVSPTAVRPGGSVSVAVRTIAPAPGLGLLDAKVLTTIAHGPLSLTPSRDADGWTTWRGSFPVPASSSEGDFGVKVCATLPNDTGTCDTGRRLSVIRWANYNVDGTPPVLVRTGPSHLDTVTRAGQFFSHWVDYGAGMLPGAPGQRIWVDGVERTTTMSGGYGTTSLADLTPGVHTVHVLGTDRAGNTAERTQVFLLTTLAASTASARLAGATVPVNPNAAVPTPSTVTFKAPAVSLDEYTATVGGNSWAGRGTLRRPFSFGTYQVEFLNETGVPKTVAVAAPTAYAQHTAGFLSVTTAPLRGYVPAASMTVSDVTVAVPTGYATPGSTATLKQGVSALGSLESFGEDLATGGYSGKVAVQGSIGACDAGEATCSIGQTPKVTLTNSLGHTDVVYTPAGPPEDTSKFANTYPFCETAPNARDDLGCTKPYAGFARSHASFGCADQRVKVANRPDHATWADLCTGTLHVDEMPAAGAPRPFLSAYLNAWTHEAREDDGLQHPTWQQSRAELSAEGGSCPNGRTGVVTAGLRRLAANTGAEGSGTAVVAGTWREHIAEPTEEDPQTVESGRRRRPTGNGQNVTREAVHDERRSYQLTDVLGLEALRSDRGWYELRNDGWIDGDGTRRSDGAFGAPFTTWTSAGWRHDDPEGDGVTPMLRETVHLITGSHFDRPEPAGYRRLFVLSFQFEADFAGCGVA